MKKLDAYFFERNIILETEKNYKSIRRSRFEKLHKDANVLIDENGNFVYKFIGEKCHLKILAHTSNDIILKYQNVYRFFWRYPNINLEIFIM